jgi:hypothetical protein
VHGASLLEWGNYKAADEDQTALIKLLTMKQIQTDACRS